MQRVGAKHPPCVLRTFGLTIAAAAVMLVYSRTAVAEPATATVTADIDTLPPDLPLPASPPSQESWLPTANILQPYGHSAYVALTDLAGRPERLKREFGFNAIIVQPPDSHNTITAAADQLTEDEFRAGIAAYRAAGYRIMLYTSLMALGLAPEFQSGQISRDHPDWLQRDPKGNPVMVWGVPWLCPSTGARQAALDRCLRIAREYDVDGIMLDNNEFYFAEAGWTCHCDSCTRAFREYVQKRFGDERAQQLFGSAPDKLTIPTDDGPLRALWLHWRNRIWADVNESFRARLREANPKMMFFANTQYAYHDGMLATDLQYEREDVVLSETVGLTSRQTSEKLVFGHALAAGRPLWNYIGTFAKADDYTGLRPPGEIELAIATTLAHNARPWIVDGFDEGPTNADSRKLMAKLLSWHATHDQLFVGSRWAEVATIISPTSRNALNRPLVPAHLTALQSAGVAVIALRDDTLTLDQLRPFRIITIESAPCLPPKAAIALAEWTKSGGTLIAAADTATHDELGRKRVHSLLWRALNLTAAPQHEATIARGHAIAPTAAEFTATALELAEPHSFLGSPNTGTEVVAYHTANALLLHIIQHQSPGPPITLNLPASLAPKFQAHLFTPDADHAQSLPLALQPNGATLTLPIAPLYCVVEIPLQ